MFFMYAITVTSKGLRGLVRYAFHVSGGSYRLARRIVAGIAVLSVVGFTATMILPAPAWFTIGSTVLATVTGIQLVQSLILSFVFKRMDEESARVARLLTLDGSSRLWVSDTQPGDKHYPRSANCSPLTDGVDR
jgi:hypothetical protein